MPDKSGAYPWPCNRNTDTESQRVLENEGNGRDESNGKKRSTDFCIAEVSCGCQERVYVLPYLRLKPGHPFISALCSLRDTS
jgi:hypothetical protein